MVVLSSPRTWDCGLLELLDLKVVELPEVPRLPGCRLLEEPPLEPLPQEHRFQVCWDPEPEIQCLSGYMHRGRWVRCAPTAHGASEQVRPAASSSPEPRPTRRRGHGSRRHRLPRTQRRRRRRSDDPQPSLQQPHPERSPPGVAPRVREQQAPPRGTACAAIPWPPTSRDVAQ